MCHKPYPESCDAIPYPHNFKMPEFMKFTGRIVELHGNMLSSLMHKWGIHGSLDHLKIRMFPLSLFGATFSWFSALSPNCIHT